MPRGDHAAAAAHHAKAALAAGGIEHPPRIGAAGDGAHRLSADRGALHPPGWRRGCAPVGVGRRDRDDPLCLGVRAARGNPVQADHP